MGESLGLVPIMIGHDIIWSSYILYFADGTFKFGADKFWFCRDYIAPRTKLKLVSSMFGSSWPNIPASITTDS